MLEKSKTPNPEELMRHVADAKARGEDWTQLFDENPFADDIKKAGGGLFDDFNPQDFLSKMRVKPSCDVCAMWRGVYPTCPKCGKAY